MVMIAGPVSILAGEMPALFSSIEKGDEAESARLANKASVNKILLTPRGSITPLGMLLMASPGTDENKTSRMMKMLLDKGADPNVLLKFSEIQISVVDYMVVMIRSGTLAGENVDVYQNRLATLKQYNGASNSERVEAMEEMFREHMKKAKLLACSSAARNWRLSQEIAYSDTQAYPSTVKNLPDTLVVASYKSNGDSYSVKLYCKAYPSRKKVMLSSDTNSMESF